MDEQMRHLRLNLRKMLPVMRTRDPALANGRT
jgi:hypothetical protein